MHMQMDQTLEIITLGWDKVRYFRIMLEVEVVMMEDNLFIKGHEGSGTHLIEELKCKVEMALGMVLKAQDVVPVMRI